MMRKAHAAAALLLPLMLLSAAHARAFQQRPAGWERFNSPQGRFNILMPAKPDPETKEVESAVGKLTLHAFSASNDTGYFLASYGDYPVEPKDAAQAEVVLDSVSDGVIKGLEAELTAGVKRISIGGNSGREFTAKKTVQGTVVVFNWRIYLVGRRLYQLAVATAEAQSKSPEINGFFTSFELNKQVARR